MMSIPRWLIFTLAAWVIVFGGYRLWVALRPEGGEEGASRWSRKSVFGRTKRAHAVYGSMYLLLGAMLLATGFGVQMPFAQGCRDMFVGDGRGDAPPEGRTLDLVPGPSPVTPPVLRGMGAEPPPE